jgi:uncharacterized membrane protein YhdT
MIGKHIPAAIWDQILRGKEEDIMDVGVWFHICCRYLYLLIPQFLLVVVNIVLKCVYSFLIIYQHILGPQADLNIQKSFCRHHFAFNILYLAHRNLSICLPNVYQVVL